jgi:hypothetical protein
VNDGGAGVTAAEPLAGQFPCVLAFGPRTGTQVLSDDGELDRRGLYLCAAPGRALGPCEHLADEFRQRMVLAGCHPVSLSPSSAEPVCRIQVSAVCS